MTIDVQRLRMDLDPEVHVFRIIVSTNKAEWRETYGSEAEALAFVRGIRAGLSVETDVFYPEVAWPSANDARRCSTVFNEGDFSGPPKWKCAACGSTRGLTDAADMPRCLDCGA